MFFLNIIDCSECSNDMKINGYDKLNKKITYKCSCGHLLVCDFELVGMKQVKEYFNVNDSGLVTYKCKQCGYNVRDYLSKSDDKNQVIINRGFKNTCKKCCNEKE